jgi:hypothetical protein
LALNFSKSKNGKYIYVISRHLFLPSVGRANTGIPLGKQTVPPGLKWGGFVRAAIRRVPKLIAERRVYLCFWVAGGLFVLRRRSRGQLPARGLSRFRKKKGNGKGRTE